MKKLFFLFSCFFLICAAHNAHAQMKNITNSTKNAETVYVTGYMNYPPFGYIDEIAIKNSDPQYVYRSIFEGVMNDLKQKSNIKIVYLFAPQTTEDKYLTDINSGETDIFLGAYYDTQKFRRTELVYPALIDNPVIIITMPQNSQKIKNLTQLKQMKGAVCSQDKFSDYVSQQMKDFSLEYTETPLEMFEKLYIGEVDFIFATQYFSLIEAAKLGIRNQLSFSKQVVWNMPMFIGVSQLSPNRKFLVQKLSSYSENPANKQKLEKRLQDLIFDIELKNRGKVSPIFIKEEN